MPVVVDNNRPLHDPNCHLYTGLIETPEGFDPAGMTDAQWWVRIRLTMLAGKAQPLLGQL